MKEQIAKLMKKVQDLIKQVLTHDHGGSSSIKLDPLNFLGFPVRVVSDASVAPAYASITGQIIFQIDNKSGTAHWYLWTYLLNVNTGLNSWHFVALT